MHGIGLVSVIEGAATYETRPAYPVAVRRAAWLNLPNFALWHIVENDAGKISMTSIGRVDTEIHEFFD